MNNKDELLLKLSGLGLHRDEAKVYLTLLDKPLTHLQISRITGVNRSKVYRVCDDLVARGLITKEQDDTGKRLSASDPLNLEITLTNAEEKLKLQKNMLSKTIPLLQNIYTQNSPVNPNNFTINTYDGVDGFKQMLWNELKAKGEILVFGFGGIEDLTDDVAWSEKHRAKTVACGYKIREIDNPNGKPEVFTANKDFVNNVFTRRNIDPAVLSLGQQVIIYNDTVNIYNWREGKKVGLEIVNPIFADMQRSIFEHFWVLAIPV